MTNELNGFIKAMSTDKVKKNLGLAMAKSPLLRQYCHLCIVRLVLLEPNVKLTTKIMNAIDEVVGEFFQAESRVMFTISSLPLAIYDLSICYSVGLEQLKYLSSTMKQHDMNMKCIGRIYDRLGDILRTEYPDDDEWYRKAVVFFPNNGSFELPPLYEDRIAFINYCRCMPEELFMKYIALNKDFTKSDIYELLYD